MSKKNKERGLGRGLSALLGDEVRVSTTADNVTQLPTARGEEGLREIPLDLLVPNPDQPRRRFAPEQITELADSIRDRGVLQPILVRPVKTDPGIYEIVAGERRWRAAQKAQLHKVPVIIQKLSDAETFEIALIENVQRSDLNPIEEARAYQKLSDDFGHSAEKIGTLIGKSRSHVANLIRLLALPTSVMDLVEDSQLSMGHARALLPAKNPLALARKIISGNLSVRETEALVGQTHGASTKGKTAKKQPDADTAALARDIAVALGLDVKIQHSGKAGGTVAIKYKTLDQLDDVCQRLCQTKGADPF